MLFWLPPKTHNKFTKRFSADIKTQNKTIFWRFFVQKAIFIWENCLFHCCSTLRNQLGVYFVNFSIVGFVRGKCEAGLKTPKNPFPMFFFGQNENFCLIIAFYIVATPLDGYLMSLSIIGCTQRNSIAFLCRPWKPQKKALPLTILGLKRNFPLFKVASLLIQHPVPPTGRWSCQFDCRCCDIVSFWKVLVRTWKPQKGRFSEVFSSETEMFSLNKTFFVATRCTSDWTVILWV